MSDDACPECGYDDLTSVAVHDVAPRAVCQACGWQGPLPPWTDDRDTERVTCDRCSTTVLLTRAITHGSVEDPDEVVCAECIKSADRII